MLQTYTAQMGIRAFYFNCFERAGEGASPAAGKTRLAARSRFECESGRQFAAKKGGTASDASSLCGDAGIFLCR